MIVEVKNLSLRIQESVILNDVNMLCDSGEICGIVGKSGCGKTTLIKCVCGFVKPTAGEVKVLGLRIGKEQELIPNAGMVIETPSFIPYYTGYVNLHLLGSMQTKRNPKKIESVMEKMGLDPELDIPVRDYSLGMLQRLGLAQAVMDNPKIIILDEPFNGLDDKGVEDMKGYLQVLREQGKAVIVSACSTENISILCDKMYRMEAGEIYAV